MEGAKSVKALKEILCLESMSSSRQTERRRKQLGGGEESTLYLITYLGRAKSGYPYS